MKKFLSGLFALLLVAGCATKEETTQPVEENKEPEVVLEAYNVLCPTGAPSLAIADDLASDGMNKYTFTTGADQLTTELAKADSEFDIIIAPINAGAKLISLGKSQYKLAAVVTWGNLYLVGTKDANLDTDPIYAFGEATVPGIVLKSIMNDKGMTNELTWGSAATDAQAALLSGSTKLALLAEPAVTATIAKAKQQDLELTIVNDIQATWEGIHGSYGFPQAAIFVKGSVAEANPASVNAYIEMLASNVANDAADKTLLTDAIDANIDSLGLPSTQVAIKSYDRQNVKVVKAVEVKKEIETFLNNFKVTVTDEAYFN